MAMGRCSARFPRNLYPQWSIRSGEEQVPGRERGGEEEWVLGDRAAHRGRRQAGGGVGIEVDRREFEVVPAPARGFDLRGELGPPGLPDFRDRDGGRGEEEPEDGGGVVAEAAVALAWVRR